MDKGWIKLYRKSMTNELLMEDNSAFILFMRLLLVCDRKTGKYRSGRVILVQLTKLKPATAYRALRRLEAHGMVRLESTSRYTDVYIINWTKYQNTEQNSFSGDHQVNSQVNSQQRGRTGRSVASTETEVNKQVSLNKNKETRITNNKPKGIVIEDVELREAFQEFVKMRTKIRKPMTEKAKQLVLDKLYKLYPNDTKKQIECLYQSIEHSWQSVFVVKQEVNTTIPYKQSISHNPNLPMLSDEERAKARIKADEIRKNFFKKTS